MAEYRLSIGNLHVQPRLHVVLPAQLLVLVARDGRVANGPAEAGGGARLADDALRGYSSPASPRADSPGRS